MSDYFPEEIIQRILLRLPTKSLIKSTLVCKSWMSLIKSSTFIQSHLSTTIDTNNQNDAHLLLLSAFSYEVSDRLHWLHWDSPEFGEYSMLADPVTFLENETISDLEAVGTCNGLICLAPDLSDNHSPTLIWNPCIRKIVILPSPPACFTSTQYDECIGFGYDSHSNDYKVLRIVTLPDDHSDLSRFATVVQVYSLARGSWKTLDASVVPVDLQGGSDIVFLNGSLHMLEVRLSVEYDDHADEYCKYGGDTLIASFDMATELFGEVIIPEALQSNRCTISKYGDSLALIKHDDYSCGCEIWVMKEFGVTESWTYLYKIAGFQDRIYGFKRCGEVVLSDENNHGRLRMISLDPKSKQVQVFGNKDYTYYFMDSFVESLILLDHVNAISYQRARKKAFSVLHAQFADRLKSSVYRSRGIVSSAFIFVDVVLLVLYFSSLSSCSD